VDRSQMEFKFEVPCYVRVIGYIDIHIDIAYYLTSVKLIGYTMFYDNEFSIYLIA
jgi:hypothetical protein